MKRIIIILFVAILLLNGCRDQSIINGTPAKPASDMNLSLVNESSGSGSNSRVQIDEVIVNISDTKGSEDSGVDITDVLVDEEEEEEEPQEDIDLSDYWGKLTVSFIDVGYGDSIFIMTPRNGTMVIDGGDDGCGPKLTKYLREFGIFYYLDVMIATNPSLRRIGGLDSILYNMIQVSEIYDNGEGSETQSYVQFHEMANNKGMFIVPEEDTFVKVGDEESVKVRLIVPYKDGYSDKTEDNSIVVKMDYGDVSFLFMSDCTEECEKKLEGYDLRADILKVAHFGANDSTSDKFIESIDPEVAIISVDQQECSIFDPDIISRLENKGIKVYRTDEYGTIRIDSDGKKYTISTEKQPGADESEIQE